MSLGIRWTTTALVGAGAGTVAALLRARRRTAGQTPPRASLGVDGLGEPAPLPVPELSAGPDAVSVAESADDAVAPPPLPEDPVAALDAARDRLRRRAEELQREMGDGTDASRGG